MTRVNFYHMACHVGLNSTSANQRLTRVPRGSSTHSRRTFPGCCGNPPIHPPPTTYPGVFGKFPGCSEVPRVFWEVPGTLGEVPGVFGKCRVFLGSSPGVLGSSGTFSEVPGCFRKLLSFGTQKTRFAIIRLQKKILSAKKAVYLYLPSC